MGVLVTSLEASWIQQVEITDVLCSVDGFQGPEDAPAATQQRAPPEPAAQSTNGALRPGWVDAIPSPTQQRLETELKEKGVPFTFLRVEDGYYNRRCGPDSGTLPAY